MPVPPRDIAFSKTATFLTPDSAFTSASVGNGRKETTLRAPTFLPSARISSTTDFSSPTMDPVVSSTISASSSR